LARFLHNSIGTDVAPTKDTRVGVTYPP
jgi:hypothetical protein